MDILLEHPEIFLAVESFLKAEQRRLNSAAVKRGLAAARAQGRFGGRPTALNGVQQLQVRLLRSSGLSYGKIAKQVGCSKPTAMRCANAEDGYGR